MSTKTSFKPSYASGNAAIVQILLSNQPWVEGNMKYYKKEIKKLTKIKCFLVLLFLNLINNGYSQVCEYPEIFNEYDVVIPPSGILSGYYKDLKIFIDGVQNIQYGDVTFDNCEVLFAPGAGIVFDDVQKNAGYLSTITTIFC